MKSVLGHTHVMILGGLGQLCVLGKGWVDMGVRGYYKRDPRSVSGFKISKRLSLPHILYNIITTTTTTTT